MVSPVEIDVLIDGLEVPLAGDWLRGIVRRALDAEGVSPAVEVGLVVTTEEKVRKLNRTYRGIDQPTDVLAFATEEGDEALFVNPPDGTRHLGEVIISYPQAVAQAAEQQHPVEREVALVIVHGVLHLLGYDHARPEDERRMRAKEAAILSIIEGGAA